MVSEDLPAEDNTAVVSRADAIESVRIVRTEPNGTDPMAAEAPEEVIPPPKAQVKNDARSATQHSYTAAAEAPTASLLRQPPTATATNTA